MRLVLVLIGLGILVSCSQKKSVVDPALTMETPVGENTEQTIDDAIKSDSLYAHIQRGACFGACKVYTLEVYNSGYIRYFGEKNCPTLGTHYGMLKKEEFQALKEKVGEVGYANFKDSYNTPNVTDVPTVTTSVLIDGKRKTVTRTMGFPKELKEFEDYFDVIIENQKWPTKDNRY